jgi:hypothetical protein
MLSTDLEYLCTGFGMLSTGLECFLQGGNAFYRVGMLSTVLEHLSTGLKCSLDGWNA